MCLKELKVEFENYQKSSSIFSALLIFSACLTIPSLSPKGGPPSSPPLPGLVRSLPPKAVTTHTAQHTFSAVFCLTNYNIIHPLTQLLDQKSSPQTAGRSAPHGFKTVLKGQTSAPNLSPSPKPLSPLPPSRKLNVWHKQPCQGSEP